MSTKQILRIFKENPEATTPSYGTQLSACFDLSACLKGLATVKGFNASNEKIEVDVNDNAITIPPHGRALVPTGIVFDIPHWASIRIHPRSGLAWKNGITLANAEAVIDADYTEQTFVVLLNTTDVDFVVQHGDRIAQAELIPQELRIAGFHELQLKPRPMTNRNGGLGSTGV